MCDTMERGPARTAPVMREQEVEGQKWISDAVSLSLPDMEKRFTLVTDCSNIAAGAMLAQESQKLPGYLQPVAFYHHALSPSEQKYSATEKELLAVVLAIKKFRVYLGRDFDLITDHQSLTWLKSLNPENEVGRRGRWLDLIQQFSMNIVAKKGKSPEMSIADFLSRVKCDGHCKSTVITDEDESSRVMAVASRGDDGVLVHKQLLIEEQQTDNDIKVVKEAIQGNIDLNPGNSDSLNWRHPSSCVTKEVKEMWRYRDRLFIDEEGILRIRFNGGRRTTQYPHGVSLRNRIIIPRACVTMILKLVHCSASAAHMGVSRTWQRARNNFWWLGMKDDVEKFVAACDLCGKNKHVNHPNKAPPNHVPLPEGPLDETMIDFIGPFQAARSHQYRYVLQIQDIFSRFLVFVPCRDSTAQTAADAMISRWLCMFGLPGILRSDRGKHFVAEVFEVLCSRLGIKHKLGAPEHPESQGQVERQNQLINQVRCLCENDSEKWPDAISRVQFSHNASINAGTGFTPSKLLFGKNLQVPEDLLAKENSTQPSLSVKERTEHDEEERRRCVERAKQNILKHREKRQEKETLKACGDPYSEGDLVRYKLNDDVRSRCHGGKIAPRYSDPYRVVKVINQYTYALKPAEGSSRGRPKVRHFNQLKTVERKIPTEDSSDESVGRAAQDPSREPTSSSESSEESDTGDVLGQENEESESPPLNVGTRWSTRNKRKTTFLQADGTRKSYD